MAMSERMQKELTKLCLAMRRANKAEGKEKNLPRDNTQKTFGGTLQKGD